MCLYYLAYSEDAMERICQLPERVITKLVRSVTRDIDRQSGQVGETVRWSNPVSFFL